MTDIIFYYRNSIDIALGITLDDNDIYEYSYKDLLEYRAFEMFKGYNFSLEGLMMFKKDMVEMNDNLLNKKYSVPCKPAKMVNGKLERVNYINFDYLACHSHSDAIISKFRNSTLVNAKGKKDTLLMKDNIQVDSQEFYFIEKAKSSGLMVLNEEFREVYSECYGYDYNKFYSHLMTDSNFRFPTGKGIAKRIKKIDYNNLKFGIYEVIITCNNPRFLTMFKFNSNDYYTSDMLTFLYTIKDIYKITFGLVNTDEGEPNCYIYENDQVNTGYENFYIWFYQLQELNKKLIDNCKTILLKQMMSGLWGRLVSYKSERLTMDESVELDISDIDDDDKTQYKILDFGAEFNKVINTEDAYKYKYARMKPFLTNYGALMMLKLGHLIYSTDPDYKIIRIHTDGIVLNKPFKMFSSCNLWDVNVHGVYYPEKDKKISGNLMFKNVLYQYRHCSICSKEFKVNGKNVDSCYDCFNN